MRALSVRIPAGRRVLDFGCGSGWVLAEAQIEGAPQRFGIDYSFAELQKAKCYPEIRFAASDGQHLPFPDETFDVVVGHVSMPYMNTSRALREIYRVLCPGGAFLLTFHGYFYLRQKLRNSLRTHNWKDVLFMGYLGVNGALNHLGLPQLKAWWNPNRFETVNTPTGVFRSAKAAGFDLIAIEHAPARIFFATTARKPAPNGAAVLPAPGWSIYCGLRQQARRAFA